MRGIFGDCEYDVGRFIKMERESFPQPGQIPANHKLLGERLIAYAQELKVPLTEVLRLWALFLIDDAFAVWWDGEEEDVEPYKSNYPDDEAKAFFYFAQNYFGDKFISVILALKDKLPEDSDDDDRSWADALLDALIPERYATLTVATTATATSWGKVHE